MRTSLTISGPPEQCAPCTPYAGSPADRPWTRHYRGELCPNAERLIQHTLVVLPWNEAYAKVDVESLAQAIRKVQTGA